MIVKVKQEMWIYLQLIFTTLICRQYHDLVAPVCGAAVFWGTITQILVIPKFLLQNLFRVETHYIIAPKCLLQVSECGRMVQKSIGGGRTRSPLKTVQLARQSPAQRAQQTSSVQISTAQRAQQTSSVHISAAQQRWAHLEKSSSSAPQMLTVRDEAVSSISENSPKSSSNMKSSNMKSSKMASSPSESSILGSSSRLLESSASVAVVPSKKQPKSGGDDARWWNESMIICHLLKISLKRNTFSGIFVSNHLSNTLGFKIIVQNIVTLKNYPKSIPRFSQKWALEKRWGKTSEEKGIQCVRSMHAKKTFHQYSSRHVAESTWCNIGPTCGPILQYAS